MSGKLSDTFAFRYGEERTKKSETVFKHMKGCGGAKQLKDDHIEVLTTVRGDRFQLSIMEAVYQRSKPWNEC